MSLISDFFEGLELQKIFYKSQDMSMAFDSAAHMITRIPPSQQQLGPDFNPKANALVNNFDFILKGVLQTTCVLPFYEQNIS
ncbi:hypothetical protein J6590_009668 [Homalodisca vitripennis]|nr:hypothetical protein J6590_009668 [Homalodisca vitripennis]